jgi:hypothetical protein
MTEISMACKGKQDTEADADKRSFIDSGRIRYHASILIAAVLVIAVAEFLQLEDRGKVGMPFWGRLPGICAWRNFFGIECPGCGLTRCFIAIAHGDWSRAWQFNPAGFLIFAVILYQIPFRSLQLWRLKRGGQDYRHGIWLINLVAWSIVASLLIQWTEKLFF